MTKEGEKFLRAHRGFWGRDSGNGLNLTDDDRKWLMERSHNDYLTWVALWLACMLGILTVLATITKTDDLTNVRHLFLFSLLYCGLVGGTIFSVWRMIQVVRLGVRWMKGTEDKALKELRENRGRLSKFLIRDNGTIREAHRILIIAIHVGFALAIFFLAMPSWVINIFLSAMSNPLYVIVLAILGYSIFITVVIAFFYKKKKEG